MTSEKYVDKHEHKLLLWLVIFGWIIHYEFINNELINPDTVWNKELLFAGSWEIALGRWMLPFMDKLQGGVNSYPLMALLTFLFYGSAAILLCKIFNVKEEKHRLMICLAVISQPLISEVLTYTYCAEGYSLSYFFAVLSVFLINNNKIILSIIAIVGSLSLYQSNIGVAAFLCLAILMLNLLNGKEIKEIIEKAKKFALMGIVGTGLYYVIYKLLMNIYNIEPVSYKNAGEIGVSNIIKNLPNSILNTYFDFYHYFFKTDIMINSYGVLLWNRLIFLLFVIAIFTILIKNNLKIVNIILVIGMVILTPLFCNIINLLAPDTRIILLTSGGMMTVIPTLLIMILKLYPENRMKICSIVICFFIWSNILINSADAKMMTLNQNKTIYLGNRIYSSICRDINYNNEVKIFIAGRPNYNNYEYDNENNQYYVSDLLYKTNSYANWGMLWQDTKVNNILWDSIFKVYYGLNLNWCYVEEYEEIAKTDEFISMPIYPEKGSIKKINDILVVKVSEFN